MDPKKDITNADVVNAINDLTRVILLLNDDSQNKSELIRKLDRISMTPTKIASLLGMNLKDVTSALSKARKAAKKK